MDASLDASISLNGSVHVVRCSRLSGPVDAAGHTPLACMEYADRVQNRPDGLESATSRHWFSRSRLTDRLPLHVFRPAHIPDDFPPTSASSGSGQRGSAVALSFRHQRPGDARHPVGEGPATSFLGLRASIRASHEPSGAPRRTACWMTAIAPTTSSRLRSRWPIFDILPSPACRRSYAGAARGRSRRRSRGRGGSSPLAERRLVSPTHRSGRCPESSSAVLPPHPGARSRGISFSRPLICEAGDPFEQKPGPSRGPTLATRAPELRSPRPIGEREPAPAER